MSKRWWRFSTRLTFARWWGGPWDSARVQGELLEGGYTGVYVVIADEQVIGVVMYTEESDPDYRYAAVDITLHPDWHGQGYGTDTLRALAAHLFGDRGHHRLTIDPAVDNHKAIRAYEAVGFRRVGVLRRYERTVAGEWRDGLLMDLLAEELR